jgi:hypothetical protein
MTSKFAGQDVASWVGIGGGVTGKAHVPSGHGGAAPSSGVVPSGGAKSNGGVKSTNKDVDAVVATMQNLMVDLGTKLSTPDVAQAVASRLQQEDPNTKVNSNSITEQAVHFSRTGSAASSRTSPSGAAGDGVWGKNTHDALVAIKNLVAQLNIKDVIISEGTGLIPYQSMKDEELIERARDNISNISRIFGALGIQTSVESVVEDSGMIVVDVVWPNLSGLEDPFGSGWGTRAVTMGNLLDLLTFYDFMSGLKPPFLCNPLDSEPTSQVAPKVPATAAFEDYFKKLADEVLDRSIIRLGQAAETVSAAVPVVPPQPSDPHCVSVIDEIIKWFSERSRIIFDAFYPERLRNRLPNPRPDQKGRIVTMHDAQVGKFYVQQMENISNAWNDIRDKVIDAIKTHGNAKSPIVTRKMVKDILGGTGGSTGVPTGKAHQRRDDGEGSEGGEGRGRTVNYGKTGQEPPLSNFIILSNFPNDLTKDISKFNPGGVLPELDIRHWSLGSWVNIAQTDVFGNTDAEKYENFGPWAMAVRDSLRNIYNDWKESAINHYNNWKRGNHNDQEVEAMSDKLHSNLENQRDWLEKWVGRINSMLGLWHSTYKERIRGQ